MRTLVLGGTGQIGNAIVRRLLDSGREVTVISRRAARPVNLADLNIQYVVGDLDDFHLFDGWLRDHDAVVDAAAPYALNLFRPQTESERDPLNYARRRTMALVEAAGERDVSLAYVGTLTTKISRLRAGPSWLQRRFGRWIQPYFAMKTLIEKLVLEAAGQGLRAIVLKPAPCLGPWDIKPKQQCWIPALVQGNLSVVPEHRVNVIDTRDLADLLALAFDQKRYGEAIPVIGRNTTVGELFALVCSVTGTSLPRWSAPAELGVLPTLWAELAWAMIGRPSPLPSLVPVLLSEQEWLREGVTERQLGRNLRPLRQTVEDTIHWYRTVDYI